MRNVYKTIAGKLKGNMSLGRPRSRWEDNIRMDLLACGIDQLQTLVNTVMNLRVP
jgi:hypothetical protein